MPKLEFWFDFASTYSYLSAMRIERLGRDAGVDIAWRPFLLGPIFHAQGWPTSPFNVYPAKGRYMIRDMERICRTRGLSFKMPAVFPTNGLAAARIALIGEADGWIAPFSKAVFEAGFARGEDIGDASTLSKILASVCPEDQVSSVRARSIEAANKEKLRLQGARAVELGTFGAPSFVCADGELFWGDDRLEEALVWAQVLSTRIHQFAVFE